MIKNLIFDVDGTLWDSTEIVARGWMKAIEETGFSKVKVTGESLKKEFGKPMDEIADDVLVDVPSQEDKNKIMELCCAYEEALLEENQEDITYDGVKEGLAELFEKYRLFIVSNCQCGYIELFMKKSKTASFIQDFECFGNTLASKGESIKILMERNSLKPEESIYIGDTMGDFLAARFAGIPFLFAAYGFGEVPQPDERVRCFSEIPEALQRLEIS